MRSSLNANPITTRSAQYPDEIDDTGIRKGAIIHYGSRRGVVAHDPQDESVAVRFPGHAEAEVLPLHEVLLARPARKEAKKLEKAAKDLHDVICQSEPYKDYGDANKATLQQIRNGDAPPVWSVNDARHRSDLEWIAAYLHEGVLIGTRVLLELHKQCWTPLEICVEPPSHCLDGRRRRSFLLLLQLYALGPVRPTEPQGLARHARRKCEDLMDVKLEGKHHYLGCARDPFADILLSYYERRRRSFSRQQLPWATPRAPLISSNDAVNTNDLADWRRATTMRRFISGGSLGEPGSQYRELGSARTMHFSQKQASGRASLETRLRSTKSGRVEILRGFDGVPQMH